MKTTLQQFLIKYPDADFGSNELIAYDAEDNVIDKLPDAMYHIEETLERSRENTDDICGKEIVDRMGGYQLALDEIRSDL